MGAFNDRLNIKYIYFSSYTERAVPRCSRIDVAILTEDNKYAEYEVGTIKLEMTPSVQQTYQSLMADWQLTPRSRIYFHENLKSNEPVRMVFKAMAQQFKIIQHTVKTDKMIRRLCTIHANFINKSKMKNGKQTYPMKKKGSRFFLQKVWRKVVESNLCPWITKAYDDYLTRRGYMEIKRRKQILRLGMFYISESCKKRGYDFKCPSYSMKADARKIHEAKLAEARQAELDRINMRDAIEQSIEPEEFKSGLFA